MKTLLALTLCLFCLSSEAALAPRAMHNTKRMACAHQIEIFDANGETQHIAYYEDGSVITILSGPDAGFQWFEENGHITAVADKVKWHSHSFTHRYNGAKVHTYTKHGKLHGQKIIYDKN